MKKGVIRIKNMLCSVGMHDRSYMDFDKGRWCRRCGDVQSNEDLDGNFKHFGTVQVQDGFRIPGTPKRDLMEDPRKD